MQSLLSLHKASIIWIPYCASYVPEICTKWMSLAALCHLLWFDEFHTVESTVWLEFCTLSPASPKRCPSSNRHAHHHLPSLHITPDYTCDPQRIPAINIHLFVYFFPIETFQKCWPKEFTHNFGILPGKCYNMERVWWAAPKFGVQIT